MVYGRDDMISHFKTKQKVWEHGWFNGLVKKGSCQILMKYLKGPHHECLDLI